MKRHIFIIVFLVFGLILCSFNVVSSIDNPLLSSKSDFDKCIDKMDSLEQNITNTEFLNRGDDFIRSVKVLREDVKDKRWEDAKTHLNATKDDYAKLYDMLGSLKDENATLFITEAHKAFKIVLDEMWNNIGEISESEEKLEEKREKVNEIYGDEKAKREEHKENITHLEAEFGKIKDEKRRTIGEVVGLLVFPIFITFVVGFFIFIPWYKKYADKHEYWGFMAKGVEFLSPVKVFGILLVVAFLIMLGYAIYRGYLLAAI